MAFKELLSLIPECDATWWVYKNRGRTKSQNSKLQLKFQSRDGPKTTVGADSSVGVIRGLQCAEALLDMLLRINAQIATFDSLVVLNSNESWRSKMSSTKFTSQTKRKMPIAMPWASMRQLEPNRVPKCILAGMDNIDSLSILATNAE